MKMETPKKAADAPRARNIFDLAKIERDANIDEKGNSKETSLLFLGSKGAGKSTAILRFLDRTVDSIKPTVALEYTYGRKSRTNDLGKDIVHIWELGGGISSLPLMESVITPATLESFKCVICIDLSRPNEIVHRLEKCLSAVRSRVDEVCSTLKDGSKVNDLKRQAWKFLEKDHPDRGSVDPILVPVVIVGTKYDVFKDFDPEHRKVICKTIRFIAHTNGASVLFTSDKDDSLTSKCKHMINALAFNGVGSRSVAHSHEKPLEVPAGSDSLSQIGSPTMLKDEGEKYHHKPMDLFRLAFSQFFPSEGPGADDTAAEDDPCRDPKYLEQDIDEMRAQMDEELERYKRKADRRARELAAKHAAKEQKKSSGAAKPKKPSKPAGGPGKHASRRTKVQT